MNPIQTILNEDWKTILPTLRDNSVDCLLTDPPFGMKFQSNFRRVKHKAIKNDDGLSWLPGWVKSVRRVVKEDGHCYIFCSWHHIDVFKREVSKHFNVKNILIWEKNNTGMGDLDGDYAPKYEMILFCSNGKRKLNGSRHPNIIRTPRTRSERHPTQKPVNLLKFFIEKSTQRGEVVLDTFGGSCSTAVASRLTGRFCFVTEIDGTYAKDGQIWLDGTAEELSTTLKPRRGKKKPINENQNSLFQ